LKDQAEALKQEEEAQKESRAAATNARSSQAAQQKAYLAEQMAERVAQFEDQYSNTWSDGTPGINMFWLTADMIQTGKEDFNQGFTGDLIKDLFKYRLIADIEEIKHDTKMTVYYSHEEKLEEDKRVKFIGITSADRIPDLTQFIEDSFKNHTHNGDFPQFDLVSVPIGTGHKQYIEFALNEVSKVDLKKKKW